MNNLPLQPLVWDSQNYTQSAFHQYLVRKDGEARKNSKSQYEVAYGRINTQQSFDVATGFTTIDEAKAWAWNHYNEKMQPYVKPLPTWIDVNGRLPEIEDFYLVYLFDGHREANVVDILYWNADHQQFLEWDFMNNVTHWQLLPSPPEGE